jgi:phosphoadenosine phosphosulfate reductase
VALDREIGHRLVTRAETELAGAGALDILKWADDVLDGRLVVASSMQDAVLIDLATKVRPDVDVLFLDTGYHFAETLGMRDAVRAKYPARVLTIQPAQTVAEQDADHGPELFSRDPDRCCAMRKVKPHNAMLGLSDGWVTGLRRAEAASRSDVAAVEWDERRSILKVNPIVEWSDDEVDDYIARNEVLVNPLRAEGYPSIGCAPCTARVLSDDDPRAGRWSGTSKTECGIHEA